MARRGFKFTVVEIEHLLETIEDVIPIGNPDWERIWQEHSACYPTKERTSESLKRKFQELASKKNPTGDPNCPPYVRDAKRIFYKIVQATDGSTGGSDVDEDFGETGAERNDNEAGDEDEDIDFSNNNEDDNISLPNPAALLPRLGKTIGGNNSYPAANRAESEQRERQSKIDAEQRDREYQLRREEMAIAREDAHAQKQLMNVMMMAMLNRNGGGDSTQPQPPPSSPMND
jgi:hypothetical protein